MTSDIYTTVATHVRPFLFMPDYSHGTFIIFSQKFENEEQLMARKKNSMAGEFGINLESLNQKLLAIRSLSNRWAEEEKAVKSRQLTPSGDNHSKVNHKAVKATLPPKVTKPVQAKKPQKNR